MVLTKEQIGSLVQLVATVEPDELDCDGCLGRIAEYAEYQLASREIPDAMRAIEIHLEQCPCCKDEYRALLKALAAIA